MKFSYVVLTKDGRFQVSDDIYGDQQFMHIFKKYGDVTVFVYDKDEVFGKGWSVKPLYKTKLSKLF